MFKHLKQFLKIFIKNQIKEVLKVQTEVDRLDLKLSLLLLLGLVFSSEKKLGMTSIVFGCIYDARMGSCASMLRTVSSTYYEVECAHIMEFVFKFSGHV